MKSEIHISLCHTDVEVEWNTYLEQSLNATIGHNYLWKYIIERAYAHRPLYLVARTEGHISGVLPLFLMRDISFRKALVSMPFLDYAGVCADDDVTAEHLVQYALTLLHQYRADYFLLRQCRPPIQDEHIRLDKVGMQLNLSLGAESVWRSFPAKVRNQVRKAEKSGLRVVMGGAEFLDDFYSVFSINMRDLGSPVHHRNFFAQLFTHFNSNAKLLLVLDGQHLVGGLICLFFKHTVFVPWASSLRQYFSRCPNNLLYWHAIEYACSHGYTYFDFGRSSINSGTYKFKRQWGAEPTQIYWQTLSPHDTLTVDLPTDNRKSQMVIKVWQRLPEPLTRVVGPAIRKYIPN